MQQNNPLKKSKEFITTLILIAGYLALQVLANLTVKKQLPISSEFAIPIGSLLWAVTFTWIDLVNDYFGALKARLLILTSIALNILMTIWLELYIWLPGTDEWKSNGINQNAIEFVFGGYWRIYMASILTSLISDNLDVSVFHYLKYNKPSIPRWARSMISNTFSAPMDAILFALLAFYGTMNGNLLLSIIITSAMYKVIISYISIPMLYMIKSNKYS